MKSLYIYIIREGLNSKVGLPKNKIRFFEVNDVRSYPALGIVKYWCSQYKEDGQWYYGHLMTRSKKRRKRYK